MEPGVRIQGLARRTVSGFAWALSGTFVQGVLSVGVLAVLARLIVPAEFGVVTAALFIVEFTEPFGFLGIGPAIVREPQLHTRHLSVGFTISIIIGVILAALVALLSAPVATFFRMDGLVPVLRLLALTFPMRGAAIVAEALLQRELRFRQLAWAQMLSYFAGYALVGVSFALAGGGLWALVTAYFTQTTVYAAVLLFVQPHSKRLGLDWATSRVLVHYGAGLTAGQLANYFAVRGDDIIVGRWLGAVALGLYGRAYVLVSNTAGLFGGVLGDVLFAGLAKLQLEEDRLAEAYRRTLGISAFILLPLSAFFYVLAPEIVGVLLGPGWSEVTTPLRIFALGLLFRTSYKISASLVRARGAVYAHAGRQLIYGACVIAGAWIGQHWGLPGVALAVLGAITVNYALVVELSLRVTTLRWKAIVKAHIPGLILGAAVAVEVSLVANTLRGFSFGSVTVLLISIAASALLILVLLRMLPKRIIGDGLWIVSLIREMSDSTRVTSWIKRQIASVHG